MKLVMFERRTSVIGGNQNYARVLLDECRRLGVEVRVVVPAPDQMTDLIGEDERVHFLSPNRGQPGSAAVQFLRLSRFLRSLGKGWTFTCNNRISGLVGLPAARLAGLKAMWFVTAINRSIWIDIGLAALCHQLLCIAPQVFDGKPGWLQEHFKRQARTLHIGVPLDQFLALEPPGKDRPLRVGVLSRLHILKAPHILLDALVLLGDRAEGIEIDIYGHTPPHQKDYAEWFAERVAKEAQGRIHLRGWTSDVLGTLQKSHAVALTSRGEGMPRNLVEAMAAARPALATAVGGVPDLIEDGKTGWVIPMDDAAAAAERLCWMRDNPEELHRMALAARQSVEHRFTITSHVRQLQEILAGLHAGS